MYNVPRYKRVKGNEDVDLLEKQTETYLRTPKIIYECVSTKSIRTLIEKYT